MYYDSYRNILGATWCSHEGRRQCGIWLAVIWQASEWTIQAIDPSHSDRYNAQVSSAERDSRRATRCEILVGNCICQAASAAAASSQVMSQRRRVMDADADKVLNARESRTTADEHANDKCLHSNLAQRPQNEPTSATSFTFVVCRRKPLLSCRLLLKKRRLIAATGLCCWTLQWIIISAHCHNNGLYYTICTTTNRNY